MANRTRVDVKDEESDLVDTATEAHDDEQGGGSSPNQPQSDVVDPEADGLAPLPMDDAPLDATRVWLVLDDGVQIEAYWRRTRRFVVNKWEPHGFWARYGTALPIGFDPVGWFEGSYK